MKKWLAIGLFLLGVAGFKVHALEPAPQAPQVNLAEGAGTIVHVGDNEALLVKRLGLTAEELDKSYDEWLSAENINDIFRLSNVGPELKVGDQIRFKYAIMTNSIPPLVPIQSYELIKP